MGAKAIGDEMSERPKPEHDKRGRFIAGNSGNGGRPKGSRNKLGEEFVATLQADFMAHGAGVVERVRIEQPAAYLKVIASVIPKELVVNSNPIDELSDEQLAVLVDIVEAFARTGSGSETADESLTTH
jgi:hypothetical protein